MVAKLDRLTRRKIDLEALIEKMGRTRKVRVGRQWKELPPWQLVPVDMPSFDTTEPSGRLAASVVGSAAQYEREMIAKRTKDALAVKKARGERVGGIPLVPEAVRQRVVRLRKRGYGWLGIAKALNDDKVKPVRGGQKWYASTAKRVWQSAQYIAERERIAQAARQRRSGRSLYAACSASRIRSGGSARSGDEGLAGAVAAMGSGAGAGDSCVPAPAHKSQAAVPRSAVRRRSPPADARSP